MWNAFCSVPSEGSAVVKKEWERELVADPHDGWRSERAADRATVPLRGMFGSDPQRRFAILTRGDTLRFPRKYRA